MKISKDLKVRILEFDGDVVSYERTKEFKFIIEKESKHMALVEVLFRCQCNRCEMCKGPKSKNWLTLNVYAYCKRTGRLAVMSLGGDL